MSRKFEKTFEVAVPVARAWQAFADSQERSKWEAEVYEIDPRPGGRVYWRIGAYECNGQVDEVEPEKILRHTEASGPHAQSEVTVTFEEVEGGTRICVTHSGFGDGDEWQSQLEGATCGWSQAIADLILYLETGVIAGRFVQPWHNPGFQAIEVPSGLRVVQVDEDGFGGRAGLRVGDVLLALGGAAVYLQSDVSVVCRAHQPGEKLAVEWVRGSERQRGSAEL